MLAELWPAPASIGYDRHASASATTRTSYAVVPSLSRPKLVLPLTPARASANALRNYNAFLTGSARAKVTTLSWAARLGLARWWPHQVHVDVPTGVQPDGIDAYLTSALRRDVLTCLYVGPVRAVQKPVLQLLSGDGETFGFAKVGVNELTQTLVRTEAANLALLADTELQHLEVPEILHAGVWQGHEVLVTRALTGTGSRQVSPVELSAAGVELSRVGGIEHHELSRSPYWQRLSKGLAELPTGPLAVALRATADQVSRSIAETKLAFGSWHGDWAPWNMTGATGRPAVWDFEQFEHGVPLGFDAIHHAIQVAVVFRDNTPGQAFDAVLSDAARLLSPFDVEPSAARRTVLLYLLEIATRYLHDGEVRSGGTTLGRLDQWLTPALSDLTSAVAGDETR